MLPARAGLLGGDVVPWLLTPYTRGGGNKLVTLARGVAAPRATARTCRLGSHALNLVDRSAQGVVGVGVLDPLRPCRLRQSADDRRLHHGPGLPGLELELNLGGLSGPAPCSRFYQLLLMEATWDAC